MPYTPWKYFFQDKNDFQYQISKNLWNFTKKFYSQAYQMNGINIRPISNDSYYFNPLIFPLYLSRFNIWKSHSSEWYKFRHESHWIHSNSNVKQMTDCNDSINVSSNKNNTRGSTQSQYWVLLTIQFLSEKSSYRTETGRNMSIYKSSLSLYFRFRTSN